MTTTTPKLGDDGSPITSGGEGGRVWRRGGVITALRAQPHAGARTHADTSTDSDGEGDTPRRLWTSRPPALADVWAWIRAGGAMPGEQPLWLERVGIAYGAVVIIPAYAAAQAVGWIVQRWSRTAAAALIACAWMWLA